MSVMLSSIGKEIFNLQKIKFRAFSDDTLRFCRLYLARVSFQKSELKHIHTYFFV